MSVIAKATMWLSSCIGNVKDKQKINLKLYSKEKLLYIMLFKIKLHSEW